MPINFPNNPANGATHTDGVIQWVYSSVNKSWTVTNSSNTSLQNSTDFDNTVVVLDRISGQNLLAPGAGFTFDTTLKTLKVVANSTQTANLIELRSSTNTLLNFFNERGVLNNAGRIFFAASQPTANAADTGLLWFNTTDSNMYIWNGLAWVIASGGVTLTDNQTISGAKTFSNNIFLSSTAKLNGQGASKSIEIAPTNASSVPATALTVASTGATFSVPVEFSSIGTTAKTVVATLADNQTISGLKTFTGNLRVDGANTSIFVDPSVDGGAASNDLRIRLNLSADGRYIRLFSNADTLNGIAIRPKNKDNIGTLLVDGSTSIVGNLTVSGTVNAGTISAITTTYGSLKSQAGPDSFNVDTAPTPISTLTFDLLVSSPTFNDHGISVTNTSTTSLVSFFCRREIFTGNGYSTHIHKITLNAGQSININGVTGPTTGSNVTIVGGKINQGFTLTGTNAPIIFTFTLAN